MCLSLRMLQVSKLSENGVISRAADDVRNALKVDNTLAENQVTIYILHVISLFVS
jgi:hypothetical protein